MVSTVNDSKPFLAKFSRSRSFWIFRQVMLRSRLLANLKSGNNKPPIPMAGIWLLFGSLERRNIWLMRKTDFKWVTFKMVFLSYSCLR